MNRLLIVDDNPKNIQLLGNILSENNYEVEYALNGKDALNALQSDDFDLILMDIMMPEMDGFEACKRIKQLDNKKDIPLIFLTAINESESISHGFELGGVDYLTKPFNTNELLARINTHISLKKSKDEINNLNQYLEKKVKRRTEKLVVLNEKLEQAYKDLAVLDQSKNDFLNIISHEIRTPLNGILGFTNFIKENVKDESIVNIINLLNNSCKRLEDFSYLALDISKLNSLGSKKMFFAPFDISEIIKDVAKSFQDDIKTKNLSLDLNLDTAHLKIDINYLSKCIETILYNAQKHSPENGRISVAGNLLNDNYLIKIKDEGTGFPKILIEKGIKAFITEHIDNNPGLELYYCKLIIENHKGTINLKNQNGALVEIQLPVNQ